MFLTNGKLVHYNADGTEEATVYTAQPNQRILMIGTSYQADVILNQSLSDAPASTAIYCEITGDAFGRVSDQFAVERARRDGGRESIPEKCANRFPCVCVCP